MALVKCPDCEKMISPRVQQCPFCGCPAEFFIKEEDTNNAGNNAPINVQEATPAKISSSEQNHIPTFTDELIDERDSTPSHNEKNASVMVPTNDMVSEDGVVFGLTTEQHPNPNKHPFTVIVDPERETDQHAKGKTHVIFRIGESKYLTVAKDNLFYAPIEKEAEEKSEAASDAFTEYLKGVSSLSGMTSGAKDKANKIILAYCQFLVEKLVQYGVYDYDLKNFTSHCGSGILIENTDSFNSILRQENNVDSYAANLAYQRDLERSSRSQWVGGGFGVKGAIKGAITAGAMNAATGAFRSIGDGMTDASDRSNVQSKYDAIVNDRNKSALADDFSRRCLFRAKMNFYRILAQKTGWNAAEVLEEHWKEADAKLNNLEHITDKSTREKILIELLSEHPFHYKILDYAMTNYMEYDFNLSDLLHYVRRISPDAFDLWMIMHFTDSLKHIEETKSGAERKQAIVELGVTFGVIDKDCNVIHTDGIDFGADVIMRLMEADMSDYGLSLKSLQDQTKDFDKAQNYFEKLIEIGSKYNVVNSGEVKNELSVIGTFASDNIFSKLQTDINEQLRKICTVRGILCKDIKEAKLLTEEWKAFDEIYSPFDSYADYDSIAMQGVIDRERNRNFASKHVNELISGLEAKKTKLEERERSDYFGNSQKTVRMLLPYADSSMYVYGSNGFIEKAKMIRGFEKIVGQESDIFPLVIYDVSDSNGFKGFVVTDKYFYNYNSMWGIGFGDKAIGLYDVRETVQNGKNRLFKMANGKTEKLKILGYEDLIIGTLSEVFIWASDVNRVGSVASNMALPEISVATAPVSDGVDKKPCPNCGNPIAIKAKFCTFCGNKIEVDEVKDEKKPCPNCGEMIGLKAKFCTFCGTTISDGDNEPSVDNVVTEAEYEEFDSNEVIAPEDSIEETTIETNEIIDTPKIQICPRCQKEIPVNAKFCTFCGYSFNS